MCQCEAPEAGPIVLGDADDAEPVRVRVGPNGWRGLTAGSVVEVTGTKVVYGLSNHLLELA